MSEPETPVSPRDTLVIQGRIRPKDIGYMNMLFESYEGLAIVRSVDPPAGLVEFWVPPSMLADFESLCPHLAEEVGLSLLERHSWTREGAV